MFNVLLLIIFNQNLKIWQLRLSEDRAAELLDEPLFCFLLADLLEVAEAVGLDLAAADSLAGASQHHVEVHAENTRGRVVLKAEIDVLIDTEAEVACRFNDRSRAALLVPMQDREGLISLTFS